MFCRSDRWTTLRQGKKKFSQKVFFYLSTRKGSGLSDLVVVAHPRIGIDPHLWPAIQYDTIRDPIQSDPIHPYQRTENSLPRWRGWRWRRRRKSTKIDKTQSAQKKRGRKTKIDLAKSVLFLLFTGVNERMIGFACRLPVWSATSWYGIVTWTSTPCFERRSERGCVKENGVMFVNWCLLEVSSSQECSSFFAEWASESFLGWVESSSPDLPPKLCYLPHFRLTSNAIFYASDAFYKLKIVRISSSMCTF